MKRINCSSMIALAAAGLAVSQPAAAASLSVSSNAVEVSNDTLGNLPLAAWKGPRSQTQQQQIQHNQQQQQTREELTSGVYGGAAEGFDV